MKIAVFHGSPKKGNTALATEIFMNALRECGEMELTEVHLPKALPAFCTGCTRCMSGAQEKCPNAQYIAPILDTILSADGLIFSTPHYGASSMPASMKNLFDHLDFLVLNVSPRPEIYQKKAFIITTGAGSVSAIKPIARVLKHWGVNRVDSLGLRMYTDKWDKMSKARQCKYENNLRRSARAFYKAKKGAPCPSTILFYHMSKFILKRFVGRGNYPYDLWMEKGYFTKRPF